MARKPADLDIELDDVDPESEAAQLADNGVAYDHPWSEEDDEDDIPDDLDKDGEEDD